MYCQKMWKKIYIKLKIRCANKSEGGMNECNSINKIKGDQWKSFIKQLYNAENKQYKNPTNEEFITCILTFKTRKTSGPHNIPNDAKLCQGNTI